MNRNVRLSRYLAGNLALILIPLLLAGLWSLFTLNQVIRKSFLDMSALSANSIASRFDEFFSRPTDALSGLSALVRRGDLYPRPMLERYLSEALNEFPFLDEIQVVGSDDRVEAVAPPYAEILGMSRAGELVYERIHKAVGIGWSDSYISLRHNDPALSFGTTVGASTIICNLNLQWIEQFTSRMHGDASPAVEVWVTDGRGIFVSHPDWDKVMQRESLIDFPRLKNHAGEREVQQLSDGGRVWLVSSARIPYPNWYVFVLYPADAFTRPLAEVLGELVGLFCLFGIAGMAWWRTRFRKVSHALDAISMEAGRISQGDYAPLKDFGEGFVEFRDVVLSLDAMIGEIGKRERTLKDRERGFREILEHIDLPAVSVDRRGLVSYVNPCMLRLCGRERRDFEGRPLIDFMVPSPKGCPFSRLLADEELLPLERCGMATRDGGTRLIDWSIVRNLDAEGGLAGLTGVGHDVTEIVQQQERIEASLKEKVILLREVHHRVNNNLQIITSLIALQESDSLDEGERRALADAGDRIRSIAMVHELLYESEDLAGIEFGPYAESLGMRLFDRAEGERVALRSTLNPLSLTVGDAIPAGLLLNEALIGINKRHAADGGIAGHQVDLEVGRTADGLARVFVRDRDGRTGSSSDGFARLATQIMEVLAQQLGGSLRISTAGAAEVELLFRPRPS